MEQYLEGETWRKVLLGTQQCRHRRITLQKAKKDLKKKKKTAFQFQSTVTN